MYIKMTNDKRLVITMPTTIYRGETNADLITFLVPTEYEGYSLADRSVVMRYVLPNEVGGSDILERQSKTYKNYLQFSTPASSRFTSEEGEITIWLTVLDFDNHVVFKTGEVCVTIEPSKDVTEYMPQENLDQLDQLAVQVADLEAALATKANDADLAAVAKSGNINDLIQAEGNCIILDGGNAATPF